MTTFVYLMIVLGVIHTTVAALISTTRCRDGWVRYKNSCYLFKTTDESWNEAMLHCQIFGAVLAEVDDVDENNFLKQELRSRNSGHGHFWLGGMDTEVDGKWRWEPSDRNITFFDWSHGQPDNARNNEDCLEFYGDLHWNDVSCHTAQSFICEYELDFGGEIIG